MSDSIEKKLLDLIKYEGLNLKVEDIKPLLEADGFNINQALLNGAAPPKFIISQAIKDSSYDIIELLMQYKPDLDHSKNDQSFNPIHMAIMEGRADVVKLLVEAGANLNLEYINYYPIEMAVVWDEIEIVEILLEHYGDCEFSKSRCQEALIYAIARDRYEIAEMLLESGRVDGDYLLDNISALETVFHYCDDMGIEKCAKFTQLLVDHGADIHKIDTTPSLKGKTILELVLDSDKEKYDALIMPMLSGYLNDHKDILQKQFNKETAINAAQVSVIKRKMAKKPKIGGLKR